ncbi:hypothetical protein Asp14428_13590 [Actinoplanes sp. NBRC 14428]|nr:hypothetical protein Asp14428_13590 [Actinoplanes sp. NBRC 14428]
MTPILPALPLLLVATLAVAPPAPATGAAPGAPGVDQRYLPADKSGLLTSRTRASRVWATVQREGGLGEIFYPTAGGPSARSLTFAVTSRGGLSKATVRTEQRDGLRFRQTFAGPDWRLTADYATDPARSTVLAALSFAAPPGPLVQTAKLRGHHPTLDFLVACPVGEQLDGSPWEYGEPDGSLVSRGRAWPLLSGERGEYEIAAGDPRAAATRLAAMTRAAGPGGMLPEQVWDRTAPAGGPGFAPGTPTFSATPLAWTHAQFLRLARNLAERRITEQPAVVADRYLGRR